MFTKELKNSLGSGIDPGVTTSKST